MQQNEHFSGFKVLEESYELVTSKNRAVEEGADLFAHLLMYFNARKIPVKQVMTELDCRANKVRSLTDLVNKNIDKKDKFGKIEYIGVPQSKYFEPLE